MVELVSLVYILQWVAEYEITQAQSSNIFLKVDMV